MGGDKKSWDKELVRNSADRWHRLYGVCVSEGKERVDGGGEHTVILISRGYCVNSVMLINS